MSLNNSTTSSNLKNTLTLSSGHTNNYPSMKIGTLSSSALSSTAGVLAADSISRFSPVCSNKLRIEGDDETLDLSIGGIKSSLYDYELLSMLETIKNILIEKNMLTQSEFDSLYIMNKNKLQEEFKDKISANKVLRKLTNDQ